MALATITVDVSRATRWARGICRVWDMRRPFARLCLLWGIRCRIG